MKKRLRITGFIAAIILFIFLILFFLPFLFREKFAEIIKSTANKTLRTEVNFSAMDVSFFHHFPNLTITLTNFSLKSSPPFSRDTLITARDISFGVDVMSIFKGPLKITRVYLNKARIILQYNEKGASNFDVYDSSSDSTEQNDTTPSKSAAIQIEHIAFIQTDFIYSDASVPLKLEAHGINYSGQSDLKNDILKLNSRVKIDSFDLFYNHVPYLASKPIKGNLATTINLNSLNIKFDKDNLFIKDIPFEFKGELAFKKAGYTFFLSLYSMFGEEYISGSVWLVSTKNLWVSVKADIKMDLQTWSKGLGIKDADLKGIFAMKLNAEGDYISGQNPASSKPDTMILGIPDFTFSSTLTNGYFRYKQYPQALTDISFDLKASSTNHNWHTLHVQLENLKAAFLKNKIEGYFRLKGLDEFPLECQLHTSLNLAEIKQVIPLDSLDLHGILDLGLDINGKYAPDKKLFPKTRVELSLKDGALQTKYYPHPVEKIQVKAAVTNQTGNLSGTKIKIDHASFFFLGNPFELNGEISNPDNVKYDIDSKGTLDVAKIYRLFSRKGMDLDGVITTDLHLKGQQSDAMAGQLDKLQNSGKLILNDIAFRSEYLPDPWVVKSGIFRFDNDKIWFEKFDSRYGASDITLNGHLSNVVNYLLAKNQTLKGSFDFHSNNLILEEFMAPGDNNTAVNQPPDTANDTATAGVIVIPENLEIGLKADLKKISFHNLTISDLTSALEVKKGLLLMKEMKFQLIGCKVGMEATYGSLSSSKAFFDFHIKADDFDIKRAYNEVELFRNLSTSAGKCEGIVSLDYSLKGTLNGPMRPVFPSLEGGGVLSLKKIKVYGLKLFTDMSKNLDKEKIKSPDLSKVDIKSTIKNNVITIEKTKMKMSGFRFRVEGATSFDGSLNLKARLGLPPLGIVGISMRVLGTQENPKFKYGRGSNDENVEETEYSDEIPPEMLEKIKSAKGEELMDDPK
jgi:AsmA protein